MTVSGLNPSRAYKLLGNVAYQSYNDDSQTHCDGRKDAEMLLAATIPGVVIPPSKYGEDPSSIVLLETRKNVYKTITVKFCGRFRKRDKQLWRGCVAVKERHYYGCVRPRCRF